MALSVGEFFSTAFTILATSLALAAIFENGHLKNEVRALDTLVATLREEVTALLDAGVGSGESRVFPPRGNASSNIFYAGTATQIRLDQPILGAPAAGELDAYDKVYPSVLAYGTVAVRGTGRLVLDGDASDVVLKIDNTYFSLRELFGFGSTLSYEAPPPPGRRPTPRAPSSCAPTPTSSPLPIGHPTAPTASTGATGAWTRAFSPTTARRTIPPSPFASAAAAGTRTLGSCGCGTLCKKRISRLHRLQTFPEHFRKGRIVL